MPMKWGIKHQVLLLALVPTFIVSTLLGAYFTSTRLQDLKETFLERGKANTLKLAQDGEYEVFSNDKSRLQNRAITTLNELGAQSVSFYTTTGEEIASAGNAVFHFIVPREHTTIIESLPTPDRSIDSSKWTTTHRISPEFTSNHQNHKLLIKENPNTIAFITPIKTIEELNDVHSDLTHTEKLIGWLKVELETKSITLGKHQILLHSSMIFLLGLLCSGIYAVHLGRNVTRPILTLAEAVERIKGGELSTRVEISSYRELEILASGVNTMALSLKNAHAELQNKVDQATLSLRRTLETIEVQNIELEIARRAAENANKIKSEFLADMSHEIRTPLNGVIGFINLLQKSELNQKQQDYIITIQKSASNLLAIINDILDFSKIEAGKLRIEYTTMDIRDCIDEVLNLLAPYAHEKNIALVPLIYSDVPPLVFGDPLRIKQIITNLVNNAIKFTEQGSVIIRVMLEHQTNSQLTIRINVSDTGVGLSIEEQKILFQAFNQDKAGTTRKFGGTGLGLVICKKLVEQMGGTIGVESEPHKGSTFWFTFQVSKHEPSDKTKKSLIEASSHSNTEPLNTKQMETRLNVSNTLQSKNSDVFILAVDDNPENLKLITVLLEDMDIKVMAVESAEEAIKAVGQQHFDLILMDIRMPKMDGIEASHIIRNLEANAHQKATPIIALTAHALASEKEALLTAGIDDYLAKPIGELELKKILQKWIPTLRLDTLPTKIIDWELGKKLAGGRSELAKEFLRKLIASLPQDKAYINKDYAEKDWEALRNHVHKLHGACCYCGVPQLKEAAKNLETAVASHSLDTMYTHLEALNLAIDMLLKEAI